MNIVHKVAVLFHANDRLSGRLSHMQGKFASLSKAQSEFAKSQGNLERLENRAAEALRRHEAALQQAQMARLRMNRAENARQRAMDQFGEQSARKFEENQNRVTAALRNAQDRQTAITQAANERRLALQRQYEENLSRLRQAHDNRRAQADRDIERLTRQRDTMHAGGKVRLTGGRLGQVTGQIRSLTSQRDQVHAEREQAVLHARINARAAGADPNAAGEVAAAAFAPRLSAINQQLQHNKTLLADHHQLVELDTKLEESQHKQRELTDQQSRAERALVTARDDSNAALGRKTAVEADKARQRDDAELHRLEQARNLHIQDADAKMRTMQGEMDAQVHLNNLTRDKLDEDEKYRVAKLHGLEAEYNAELRNSEVVKQRMAAIEAHHQRLQQGVGLVMGAGVVGAGLIHAVHSLSEAGNKAATADQQLHGMGINGDLFTKVQAINQQQSGLGRGIDYKEAADTFKMLHAVLGGPGAVLGDAFVNGKGQADTSVLTLVNKFKAGMRNRYNLSDASMDNAIRAAELGSASNRPDGKPKTREERMEHFTSRLQMINQAFGATGGTLRINDILGMMKAMQSSKFGLSNDGFLRLSFVAQELGGSRTGNAFNGMLTNMLMGQQSGQKNMGMANLGLVNIHDKSIKFTKDGTGIKSFDPMTAFNHGNLLTQDPVLWMRQIYMPKLQEAMKKAGKTFTPENAQMFLTTKNMSAEGRQTVQGLVSIMFQQSQRIEDDFNRAKKHAEDIDATFARVSDMYKFQAHQTSIEWENLQNQLSKGVLPVATEFLKALNPTLRAMADAAKNHPEMVGAVFGAVSAAALTAGLSGVVMVFQSLRGLASIATLARTAAALETTAAALAATGVSAPLAATGLEELEVAAAAPGLGLLGSVAGGLTLLGVAVGGLYLAVQSIKDPKNPIAEKMGLGKKPRNVPTPFAVPPDADSANKTPAQLLADARKRTTVVPYGHQLDAPLNLRTQGAAPRFGQTTTVQVKPLIEGPVKAEMTLRVLVEAKGNTPIDQKNASAIAGSAVDRLHSAHPNLSAANTSRANGALPSGVTYK